MRLLHTADWQIGKPFGGFEPDDSVLLTAARIDTVKAIAKAAADEGADLVLVAGDVFDAQTISDKTIQQTFNALAGFQGQWVFLPGNHDAALVESVWTRATRLGAVPANAVLCLAPEVVEVLDGKAVIIPAPLTQRNTFNDLTEWFVDAQTAPGALRVGLAHGSVQGILPDNIESANPIAPDIAARAGLDYLALGDWHGLKKVDERTWYSGTPEPDRFRSVEPGHVLLVDVEPDGLPQVRPLRIAQYDWKSLEHALNVPGDLDVLDELLGALSATDVVEVRVTGSTDLQGRERVNGALSKAQGVVRALRSDLDGLRLLPSQEDLDGLRADGYLAETIDHLRSEQATGVDPELARDALVVLATTIHGQAHKGVSA